jgi:hypothetical protein
MPDFDEVRFPTAIARGAVGGPERRTEIVALVSGHEGAEHALGGQSAPLRHRLWHPLRRRSRGCGGLLRGARRPAERIPFKDWSDYKSCSPSAAPAATDQAIGVGTGALATFQIVKHHTSGVRTWVRTIRKPVAGTVQIAVNGDPKTAGSHFNAGSSTGVVAFTPGNIPGAGQAVTAGYEFDVPVRFDTELLQTTLTVDRSFRRGGRARHRGSRLLTRGIPR